MNNYILESMDITDVFIDDIEYEKQLAEINVIEALVECYEKQLVLLEYNEESACEIMMEYGIIMETSDDKRPLSIKAKAAFNKMISALKTLVLSIIDQIRAANFKKLAKIINNMGDNNIEIEINSNEFKNKDSVFFIINANSICKKLSKIIDDLRFIDDDRLNAEMAERDESAKNEYIEKSDELIKEINRIFDDGKDVDSVVQVFNKDNIIGLCSSFDGDFSRNLRTYAHKLEKWNNEYSRFGYGDDYSCIIGSKLREIVKAFIKFYTRLSKAIIPIFKVIRNVIKNKDQNKFKNVTFSEKDKDFMKLIHELAKIYDNVDKYLNE